MDFKKNKKYTKVSLSDITLLGGSFSSMTPFFRTINQTFNYKFGNEIAGQEGLYRVFFNASNASYARCFTDKEEAERFYNGLLHADCCTNVALQEG